MLLVFVLLQNADTKCPCAPSLQHRMSDGNPHPTPFLSEIPANTVTNTRSFIAAEVVQLYFRRPNEHSKAKNLHRFGKTPGLKPSESADVQRPRRRKDLSISSVGEQQWSLSTGD